VEPSPAERVDQPLAMSRGGQDYYIQADHQGSVIRVTDSAGAVVNSYAYDAYGQRLTATEGVEIAFGYTGREYDAESGLMYYRARVYDPAAGRFLQTDPLGFGAGDFNLYRYVLNDPVDLNDPSGKLGRAIIVAGACVVGGATSYSAFILGITTALAIEAGFKEDLGPPAPAEAPTPTPKPTPSSRPIECGASNEGEQREPSADDFDPAETLELEAGVEGTVAALAGCIATVRKGSQGLAESAVGSFAAGYVIGARDVQSREP
jgi:RHS repeat-associated protein